MTAPVVKMEGVSKTFDSSPPVHAVRSADLTVSVGEYLSIVGPSGSGKSTLLNLLGCLDRPSEGTYELNGTDVASLGDGRRAALRGQTIGFVFQTFHLLPHRTVTENVMVGMLYNRVDRGERALLAREALERVGLAHRHDFLPTRLSGGEQQRAAIARAVVARPSLVLCDEPTGNLDSATTGSILDLFDELIDSGLTIVSVTHDPAVSERAHRQVEIVDGLIVSAA